MKKGQRVQIKHDCEIPRLRGELGTILQYLNKVGMVLIVLDNWYDMVLDFEGPVYIQEDYVDKIDGFDPEISW